VTAVGERPALPSIEFRQAREDDIPRCAEVWWTATNHYITALNQPALPDDLSIITKLYVHLRATDPERFVVAVTPSVDPAADRVIAFAVALQRDHVWFLSMLFVLPDVQLRGLGRELLARVLPQDGAVTVRATATDSAQPISNALYSTYGIVPRLPLLNLVGLPTRPEVLEPFPSGVTPVSFQAIVDGGGSDGHRQLATAVDALDRDLLGFSRAVDHGFMRQQDRRGWLFQGPDGTSLGYGYSAESGRLGPILVRDPALLGPAMGHLLAAVQPRGPFITWIPGAADRALVPALAAGLRLDPFPILLCWDRQPTDFERYLPISPGML
jgi:hypothetical protein